MKSKGSFFKQRRSLRKQRRMEEYSWRRDLKKYGAFANYENPTNLYEQVNFQSKKGGPYGSKNRRTRRAAKSVIVDAWRTYKQRRLAKKLAAAKLPPYMTRAISRYL